MDIQQLHTKIFQESLAGLPYRTEPHPLAIISFCGIPGSGKTTLARQLTKDLHANYIQLDAMRRISHNHGFENVDIHSISKQLIAYVAAHSPNGLFILDASIDRRWPEFIEQCKQLHATPVIIRITITAEEAGRNLEQRMRHDDPQLIKGVQKRLEDFENCKKHLSADVETTFPSDYKAVYAQVASRLAEIG